MSRTSAPRTLEASELAEGLDCRNCHQCTHPGPAQVQGQPGKKDCLQPLSWLPSCLKVLAGVSRLSAPLLLPHPIHRLLRELPAVRGPPFLGGSLPHSSCPRGWGSGLALLISKAAATVRNALSRKG